MTAPKVSVCIPAYNGARYLGATIESVLGQDFRDYEVVVCDDASTDDTPAVCERYRSAQVRYLRFAERGGASRAWNRCVEQARGTYVVLLHADDMLDRTFLRRAVAVLDGHREVGFVHCTVQHIDEEGRPLHLQRLYEEDRIDTGEVLLRRLLLEGCVVNPAGVMVRRHVYETVGPFTDKIVWGVDWHMWLRIALQSQVAYLAEPLAFYREHATSDTSGVMAAARNGSDEVWLMTDIFQLIGRVRPELLQLRGRATRQVAHRTWCFAEEMCQRGLMRSARRGLRRSIQIRPRMLLEGRVWALWTATYLGYRWFVQMRDWKHRFRVRVVG